MLTPMQQEQFKAFWKAGRTCAYIGLRLGITVRQVKEYRPALGLPARHKPDKKRVSMHVYLPDHVVAALTEKARDLSMPRSRYVTQVLVNHVAVRRP